MGPTAKEDLVYVKMFNLLTGNDHVNLPGADLKKKKGGRTQWIVSIYSEYSLVIDKFYMIIIYLTLLWVNGHTINTMLDINVFKRLHRVLL